MDAESDGERKKITMPKEVATELALLNDMDISDEEMLFNMR